MWNALRRAVEVAVAAWRRAFTPGFSQGEYGARLRPVFICRGRTYYSFGGPEHLPIGRALAAQEYLADAEVKLDHTLLRELVNEIEHEVLGGRKTSQLKAVMELKKLTEKPLDPVIVLRLASIYFVDPTREDPAEFDYAVAEQKVEAWQRAGLYGFFLSTPISHYVPGLPSSQKDIETWMTASQKMMTGAILGVINRAQRNERPLLNSNALQSLADSVSRLRLSADSKRSAITPIAASSKKKLS